MMTRETLALALTEAAKQELGFSIPHTLADALWDRVMPLLAADQAQAEPREAELKSVIRERDWLLEKLWSASQAYPSCLEIAQEYRRVLPGKVVG